MNIWSTILSGAVIAALIGLVEVLLRRMWDNQDKKNGVYAKLDRLEKMLAAHIADDEKYKAETKRARILQFNKEVRQKERHSEEEFIEILKVIDEYEDYCRNHPEYPNNRAVTAIENIKYVYKNANQENDFVK